MKKKYLTHQEWYQRELERKYPMEITTKKFKKTLHITFDVSSKTEYDVTILKTSSYAEPEEITFNQENFQTFIKTLLEIENKIQTKLINYIEDDNEE